MLENTLYCLTKRQKLTVAYFGGSITEGAGATDYKYSWAGRTTAWLRERFPDAEINGIQAAIGGTGSTLGVFRCEENVCAYHPDLIFYEYACNDSGGDFMTLLNNCDAIFRKIWKSNPFADIVMIYTSTKSMSDCLIDGNELSSRTAQSAAAYYYGGIPQIDIGEALRYRVISEGGDWKKYTGDTVHPTDAGYAIYAETIFRHLASCFDNAEKLDAPRARKLPQPLFSDTSRIDARMVDAYSAVCGDGWQKVEQSLCGRYPHYIEALNPGAELTFTFTGTQCDIYWMMAKDSGDIVFSVDDGPETTRRSWDHYCMSFNRANSAGLVSGLKPGRHTLRLRVADTKEERSEGTAIRIAAFLVL